MIKGIGIVPLRGRDSGRVVGRGGPIVLSVTLIIGTILVPRDAFGIDLYVPLAIEPSAICSSPLRPVALSNLAPEGMLRVTGWCGSVSFDGPFVWTWNDLESSGQLERLPMLESHHSTVACDINNEWEVVGEDGTARKALFWTPGLQVVDLNPFVDSCLGEKGSRAMGVNAASPPQVVGLYHHTISPQCGGPACTERAARWDHVGGESWTFVSLAFPPQVCGLSYAQAINSHGEIVGVSDREFPYATSAVVWSPPAAETMSGSINVLGGLAGDIGFWSRGKDINVHGQAVGVALTPCGVRAFLWLPTASLGLPAGMHSLGPQDADSLCGRTVAINEPSQVVGRSGGRAYLWENGLRYDINDLLVNPPPNVVISNALDINDQRWIAAIGNDGKGYLLKPTTVPPGGGARGSPVQDDTGDCDCDGDIDVGDCDCNAEIDLFDLERFFRCANGPNVVGLPSPCRCVDSDDDGDVDFHDFRLLQLAFAE